MIAIELVLVVVGAAAWAGNVPSWGSAARCRLGQRSLSACDTSPADCTRGPEREDDFSAVDAVDAVDAVVAVQATGPSSMPVPYFLL